MYITLPRETFERNLMKIVQRVQDIWSGQKFKGKLHDLDL